MRMDLRTGCPIWLLYGGHRAPAGEPLADDMRCRVAIVGGGITCALVADRLTRDGVDRVATGRAFSRNVACDSD